MQNNTIYYDLIREMFEDADLYGYIKSCESYADTYDVCAKYVFDRLSSDLTIEQIQNIIWNSFYDFLCVPKYSDDNEMILGSREQGKYILGDIDQFKKIAKEIKNLYLKK